MSSPTMPAKRSVRAREETTPRRTARAARDGGTGASPPTARVVRVLEHLAQHDTPLSAAGIARALGQARATCGLILDELVACGWVARTTDGYVLGVGVVPVARRALVGPASGTLAHEQLVALAADLHLPCTTTVVSDDHIVIVDEAHPGQPHAFDPHIGTRYRIAAPVGAFHVAWEPDLVVDAWLARAPQPLTTRELEQLRGQIGEVRAQGVMVLRYSEPFREITTLLGALREERAFASAPSDLADLALRLIGVCYTRAELRARLPRGVSTVGAPVFGPSGRLQFMIGVRVMRASMPHREVRAVARRVREAADAVTESIGGTDPWAADRTTPRRPELA